MPLPAVLGIASTVLGGASTIMGGFASHQQAKARTDYTNRITEQRYRDTLKTRSLENSYRLNVYNQQKADYEATVRNIREGLSLAGLGEQFQLNEDFARARFTQQQMLQDQLEREGMLVASGQAGRSTDRARALLKGAAGRNSAILEAGLLSRKQASEQRMNRNRLRAQSDINQAYSKVAVAPMLAPMPSAPIYAQGPSGLGLATSIIGGLGQVAGGLSQVDWDSFGKKETE